MSNNRNEYIHHLFIPKEVQKENKILAVTLDQKFMTWITIMAWLRQGQRCC